MTAHTTPDGQDRLTRRRRARRAMLAAIAFAVLGMVVGERVAGPVVAVGLYWTGVAAFVGIWRFSPVPIGDERNCALERRASQTTLLLAGAFLVVVGPATTALEETGTLAVGPRVEGGLTALALLFGLFGASYLYHRYRP